MPSGPTTAFPRADPPPPRGTARALVAAQAVLLIVLAGLPRRTDWPLPAVIRWVSALTIAAGGGIAAAGAGALGHGLTALPLPNGHARLRTGGLYRWVRHPIYSGVLLAAAGRTAVSGNRWAPVVFAALIALLTGKARFEEQHLSTRFPEYRDYADRTPRFVPRRQNRRPTHPGGGPTMTNFPGGTTSGTTVTGPGVVVHVNDNDQAHLTAVLQNVTNLVRDLDGAAPVEVVAHGPGLDLVLTGGPLQGAVRELLTRGGVGFVGCANSLRGRELPDDAVAPGVRIVPAGVGHLTRRQWQGWAYLHP